jgi:hypothetical protein
MTRALASARLLAGVLVVLAFNVFAFVLFTRIDGLAQPAAFTAWFLGDAAVGLIALRLTDRG